MIFFTVVGKSLCLNDIGPTMSLRGSPLRDMVVENIWGGRKKIVFVFAFSQNFCVLSQNQLSSDKLFLFTLQLEVVTALYFHNVHRVLF